MLYFVLGVLAVLLAVMTFFMLTGWVQAPGSNDARLFVTKADIGEIRISENALENIIRIGIDDLKGVKCRRIVISEHEGDLGITVHCQLEGRTDSERIIPAIRAKARDIIQEYSGIRVKEVKVLVQDPNNKQLALRK